MTGLAGENQGQQHQNNSTPPQENSACAALFCATLSRLNEISERQIKALLDFAITAAQAAHSLSSPSQKEGAGSAVGASSDELSKLADKLGRAAEKIGGGAAGPEGSDVQEIKENSEVTAEAFCAAVEQNINLAMQNSVAHQQALNVLGQAILARAASLLLSAVSPGGSGAGGQ